MVNQKSGSRKTILATKKAAWLALFSPFVLAEPAAPMPVTSIEDINQVIETLESSAELQDETIYASVQDKPLVRIPLNVAPPKKKQKEESQKNYLYELTTLINDRIHYYFSTPIKTQNGEIKMNNACSSATFSK